MRINYILGLALCITMVSCGGGKKKSDDLEKAKGEMVDEQGNKVNINFGGIFKMNQVDKPSTLFPHGVGELTGHNIANQVYEGLVKLSQDSLIVKPCLAESYTVNEDATVFTYKLRKNVLFHDDKCFNGDDAARTFDANDVKFCLDQLCTPSSKTKTKKNDLSGLVLSKIKGAQEYHDSFSNGDGAEGGVSGIKVIDDYTIEITLAEPFASFNQVMTTPAGWIFPKEAVDYYEAEMGMNPVGTGPFKNKTVDLSKNVILVKNESYWDKDENGNALPYLSGLKFTFIPEKKTEFLGFNKGDLDMVWKIPVDEIDNVLQDFNDASSNAKQKLQTVDGITIQFYAFLNTHEVFKDKRVRQAFNYAIDRDDLVDRALYGEGKAAHNGIVPSIKGYPQSNVKGFDVDIQKAKQLLAEAGYPNGKGFPEITLHINSGGSINVILANAIQQQLYENLGVTIKPDRLSLKDLRNKFESGNSALWRTAWVADYPDPENFLYLFHSKHLKNDPERTFYNAYRYVNPEFDAKYNEAVATLDKEERMRLFAEADQILIDDAVVMPIYYDTYERLLAKKVMNFPINGMEYRDFTRVFFDDSQK